jgi:hypothetical protein
VGGYAVFDGATPNIELIAIPWLAGTPHLLHRRPHVE